MWGGGERDREQEERRRERKNWDWYVKKKRLNDSKSPKSLSAHCPIVDSFVNYHLLQEVASLMMAE